VTKTTNKNTIFQVNPPITRVTYNDINDAIDASYKLSESNKLQYFYTIGIDYDNVKKYYDYVLFIEKVYNINKKINL
jgi:hypothetical protein